MPLDTILHGDALATLRTLPAESVQCAVTSPPYWGLRDYGVPGQLGLEATPQDYVSRLLEVFCEVRRVLRNDGTLWLNLGDSYGAGKQLLGMPWRVAFALQGDGWILRSDIIWHKPNPMPESVTDRPTKAHEYLFLLSKRADYHYDADAIREPHMFTSGSAQADADGRTLRTTTGDKTARDRRGMKLAAFQHPYHPAGRNKRSVWSIATAPFPEAHFATFPPALVEPCILAGSRPGDVVLDTFMGAGTVGVVCRRHSRRYLGIELNAAYLDLAERRIAAEVQPVLWTAQRGAA